MADGVSIREFARLDGCNEKLVRRAIQAGRLSLDANGKVDPQLAGTGWRKSNRRADAEPNADTADVRGQPAPPCHAHSQALRALIDAATAAVEIEAIDVTAGWPGT